jgi:cytoskeletal protein CcmA (bactofilin family)
MSEASRRFAFAAIGLLALTIGGSPSFAQSSGHISDVGPVVSIEAAGDEIRAAGARVSIDGSAARVKAAGATVDVRGAVEGNIWAAGADVTVDAQSGGTVRVAGARVITRGRVAGDLMAAGAVVDVDLPVGGALRAAGASVRIGPLADVGGTVEAAGANLVFEGHAAGSADFGGAIVTLNGRIDGPVTVHAERLIVGPQAVLGGTLLVRSIRDPQIDPAATISGEVLREQPPASWLEQLPAINDPSLAGIFAVSVIFSGLVLMIFARNTFSEAVDHFRFRPVQSLIFGIFASLVLLGLAIILMVTLIGFPLGFSLLLLFPVAKVLALPVAAAGLIGWVAARRTVWLGTGSLLFFLITGAIILGGVLLIPVTGIWIVLVLYLFGFGAFLRATLWRFRIIRPAAPLDLTPGVAAPVGEAR